MQLHPFLVPLAVALLLLLTAVCAELAAVAPAAARTDQVARVWRPASAPPLVFGIQSVYVPTHQHPMTTCTLPPSCAFSFQLPESEEAGGRLCPLGQTGSAYFSIYEKKTFEPRDGGESDVPCASCYLCIAPLLWRATELTHAACLP